MFSEHFNQGLDEVAVVIPSRDRWHFLRTSLASALAQRDVLVSPIVVDDGSTGRAADQIDALGHHCVRVLRHDRPVGVSAARNVGLAHVTAPWVAFLDDDDVWAPDYLSAALKAVRASGLDRERVGLVFSGHLDLDARYEVTHVSPAASAASIRQGLQRMNVVGCPSRVVLSTTAVRDVGGFDPRFSIVADWDLWVRVTANHEVVRCPELLVGYTHHTRNMHRDPERFIAEVNRLREKHGWSPRSSRDAVFGDLLPGYVAGIYRANGRRLQAARWYLRSYRLRRGRRDLARAVGALLGERLARRLGARRRPSVDPALGQWVDAVRQAQRAAPMGLVPLTATRRDSPVP